MNYPTVSRYAGLLALTCCLLQGQVHACSTEAVLPRAPHNLKATLQDEKSGPAVDLNYYQSDDDPFHSS